MSAKLGGHVSSSTLSAHQMARAGEPVDSVGSDEWVLMRTPDIGKSYTGTDALVYPLVLLRASRSSGSELAMRRESSSTGTWIHVSVRIHSLHCLLGDGLRGEGLGIPSPLLGCHQVRGAHRAPVMDVPVINAAQVPAFLRERGGASVSVPRQSAPTSSCASEACTRSANCAKAGDSTVQFFDVVYVPTVVRLQVPEMVQTVQKIVKIPHAFLDMVVLPVVDARQGLSRQCRKP